MAMRGHNADDVAERGPPVKLAAGGSAEPVPIGARASVPDEAKPSRCIAEFDSVIARRDASFVQLATAILNFRDAIDTDERSVYEHYIEPLTEAFETAHGHITHSFYCRNRRAAAALTDRHELWFVDPPGFNSIPAPIADLLFKCDRLKVEASRLLVGPEKSRDLQTTMLLTYTVLVKLLILLDESPTQPPPRDIVDLHNRELGYANDYYLRAAERYAQFDYFRGMLIGVLVCVGLIAAGVGLIALGALLWTQLGFELQTGKILVFCLMAGAIGAVVSVMSRMTFGELSLDYEAGRQPLWMLGAFRPIIGMTFGAAMWVLANTGLFIIGPNEQTRHFAHILIAFLAGFSERWAQDMLGRTADQISNHGGTRNNRDDAERIKNETAKSR